LPQSYGRACDEGFGERGWKVNEERYKNPQKVTKKLIFAENTPKTVFVYCYFFGFMIQ
jgi:hypothetical protein